MKQKKHMQKKYRACIYMRLSHEEQIDDISLETQKRIKEEETKIEDANKIMTKFLDDLKIPFYRREKILKI